MKVRFWLVTLAASAVVVASTANAAAATDRRAVAVWNMDDWSGRWMYDDSGYRLDGWVGREVDRTGGAYRFGRLDPDTPPARPEHLVTVADDDALDPGTRDYAIVLRLRTSYTFGNVIQKGQATASGGSFKIQIPNGRVQCWFRGSAGSVLVTAPRAINDGRWHTVRCERTFDGVGLYLDGRRVAQRWGWTGSIENDWPISIGGKTDCDQVTVGCDYFAGDIDWIDIEAQSSDW